MSVTSAGRNLSSTLPRSAGARPRRSLQPGGALRSAGLRAGSRRSHSGTSLPQRRWAVMLHGSPRSEERGTARPPGEPTKIVSGGGHRLRLKHLRASCSTLPDPELSDGRTGDSRNIVEFPVNRVPQSTSCPEQPIAAHARRSRRTDRGSARNPILPIIPARRVTANKNDLDGREFDALMERHGLAVPPDRRAGIVSGVKDLRRLTTLLRRPRPAELEPAAVFRVDTVVRNSTHDP